MAEGAMDNQVMSPAPQAVWQAEDAEKEQSDLPPPPAQVRPFPFLLAVFSLIPCYISVNYFRISQITVRNLLTLYCNDRAVLRLE